MQPSLVQLLNLLSNLRKAAPKLDFSYIANPLPLPHILLHSDTLMVLVYIVEFNRHQFFSSIDKLVDTTAATTISHKLISLVVGVTVGKGRVGGRS